MSSANSDQPVQRRLITEHLLLMDYVFSCRASSSLSSRNPLSYFCCGSHFIQCRGDFNIEGGISSLQALFFQKSVGVVK